MRAILIFNLPEESHQHAAALAGAQAIGALTAVDAHLRNAIKYGEHSPETARALQDVRDLLREESEGIEL